MMENGIRWNILIACIFITCIYSCIPAVKKPIKEVTLDVNDPTFQKIYNYQDKQMLDSILQFTSDFNPSYRYMVANAFASYQDSRGLDSLYKLLNDPVIKVRTAAAYAIGQIGEEKSTSYLLEAFKTKDTLDVDNIFNSTILEAVGKLGQEKYLAPLATVSSYRATDTLLLAGQSRAIYNYALRGITKDEGTDKMVQYLTTTGIPEQTKLIAANYLARTKSLDLTNYKFQLGEILASDKNPNIRMALAIALGRTKDKEILTILQNQYATESDTRVKTNILRAISNYPYIQVVDPIIKEIANKDLAIAQTAANYLVANGNRNDATIYKSFINDSLHYSVQALIYEATMKHLPSYYSNTRATIIKDIKAKIDATDNPYAKAAYLKAYGHDPKSYKEVLEMTKSSKHAIVRSSGAEAIASMLKSPNFIAIYQNGHRYVKREILALIKDEILEGDAGITAVYGALLSDDKTDLKALIDSAEYIKTAAKNLKLPQEIESYNSLMKAYSYLTDSKYTPKQVDWNHDINWNIFSTYGDSAQVAIKTEKGIIRAELYSTEAPGSVANFITLADADFYNGKTFHRVVNNFVIQGGCPRGDGYGSENYTIRSELPQMYYDDEGYIGMASAGLHTEGTQWFITHSPTMHLNGKYTIFGKVTKGMDIVQQISVGDKITDIIITK